MEIFTIFHLLKIKLNHKVQHSNIDVYHIQGTTNAAALLLLNMRRTISAAVSLMAGKRQYFSARHSELEQFPFV